MDLKMSSFAAPVGFASDGSFVQREMELLKTMPNKSEFTGEVVKMNPYTDTGIEGKGMGISLEISSTYCAREGCTVCEYPRKAAVAIEDGDGSGNILPGSYPPTTVRGGAAHTVNVRRIQTFQGRPSEAHEMFTM